MLIYVVAAVCLLPFVEIAVLIQVGAWIGALDALVLLLVVSFAGIWLVKRAGIGAIARIRADIGAGRVPTASGMDGALLVAAGCLLIVPGFVSDAVGFALLVPPVRRGVGAMILRRVAPGTGRPPGRPLPPGPPAIDV